MKFGKHFAAAAGALPLELRAACVDYRAWKKLLRQRPYDAPSRALLELEAQCEAADRCFRRHHERMRGIGRQERSGADLAATLATVLQDVCSLLSCMCLLLPTWPSDEDAQAPAQPPPTPSQLLQFAHLNAASVAKTCKRLAKHYSDDAALPAEWLSVVRGKRAYAFMGGHRLTDLSLQTTKSIGAGCEMECPVCLDPCETTGGSGGWGAEDRRALILPCGHVLCLGCALRVAGVHSCTTGAWYNRLAFTPPHRAACPMCRCRNALRRTWDMYLAE